MVLVVAGGLFQGCQKNEIVADHENGLSLKSATTSTCVNTFSEANAVSVYENTDKNVSITAWNDVTTTFVKVTRTGGNMTVRAASPGLEETQTNKPTILDAGTSVVYPVANPENWSCGDVVDFSFYISGLGGGNDNKFQTGIISYQLRGLCTTTTLVSNLANPVCVDDEVTLTAAVTASEAVTVGTLKIQEWDGTTWTDVTMTTATTFAYTPDAEGTRTFRAVYSGTGTAKFCSSQSADLEIIAEVCVACEESFTYVDNGDNTYTFTYTPEVGKEDAFLEFTFPQGVVISAPEGWEQPGNSDKSVVRQLTTDLEACEAIIFTFGLVHADQGQGPLWTDFKVDGMVKN